MPSNETKKKKKKEFPRWFAVPERRQIKGRAGNTSDPVFLCLQHLAENLESVAVFVGTIWMMRISLENLKQSLL